MAKESSANRAELLQGTLDMLILKTLQWGPQHGQGIGQAIRTGSGELLQVETGSLYPALHRLEKQGWLSSEWKVSNKNQRAKYYRLTVTGKKQLLAEQSKWKLLVKAITGVMKPA
jgi:PadR family transcriptional regulator PadR